MLLFRALSSINLTKNNKKNFSKCDSFTRILQMNPPRIYFWILEQNQSHLFANVLKYNSKGIFALWRFAQILRWWVKMFPNSFTRSNIAWENSRHLATLNHWFSRQMTFEKRAQKFHTDDSSLPRSGKSCQRYFFREIHENCYVYKSGIYRKRKTEKKRK